MTEILLLRACNVCSKVDPCNQVHEYLDDFMRYSHLWKADKQQAYVSFMKTMPSLEAFDAELRK